MCMDLDLVFWQHEHGAERRTVQPWVQHPWQHPYSIQHVGIMSWDLGQMGL
jgi:hypothetical protein